MAPATLTVAQVPTWRPDRRLPHHPPAEGLDVERARGGSYPSGGDDA